LHSRPNQFNSNGALNAPGVNSKLQMSFIGFSLALENHSILSYGTCLWNSYFRIAQQQFFANSLRLDLLESFFCLFRPSKLRERFKEYFIPRSGVLWSRVFSSSSKPTKKGKPMDIERSQVRTNRSGAKFGTNGRSRLPINQRLGAPVH